MACCILAIALFACLADSAPAAANTALGARRRAPFAPDSLQIAAAIASALDSSRPPQLSSDEWKSVARLYGRGKPGSLPAPLWLDGHRLAIRASQLTAVLAGVDTVGLRPRDYPIGALRDAMRAAASPSNATNAAALARADVLLTASWVALVDDLLTGRVDPRKVEPAWHIAPRAFDVNARVQSALDTVRGGKPVRDVLASLRQNYGSYGGLIQALARYRALERSGGWAALPTGPTLRAGDVGPVIPMLRRRLAAEGYSTSAAGSDTLDATLGGAIVEFQRRHGLTTDSAVGPRTRAALDVSAAHRVRQIEANLERVRWLPPDLGERFIIVNVPAFILYAFDGGKRVLDMRVVVGDELASRRTPIFADTMEYIQFGPYWNVPRSIAVNEILPMARADRGFLARNHYQMLRGWGDDAPVVNPNTLSNSALFSSRYRVRQLPGPLNALGRVKFMFPNDYSVYLHDTPATSRFEDTNRAVSHGCVRVADPEALADYVLRDHTDWPRDRIATTLRDGTRVRVQLSHGMPVYLIYLTAFARDGEVAFRDDLYDRDTALLHALAE